VPAREALPEKELGRLAAGITGLRQWCNISAVLE
jgi:hypothetical protein